VAWRDKGHDLAVRVTWEGGDAERYVEEALSLGYTTVIAGGGDGSVRDIVHAMMTSERDDLALAILPLGTANDFATAAGTPESISEAIALLDAPPTDCDVIQVNDHYFLNMATGGFGTEVTTQTSEDLKNMLGGAAYLLTGLTRFSEIQAAEGSFSGDDFEWQGGIPCPRSGKWPTSGRWAAAVPRCSDQRWITGCCHSSRADGFTGRRARTV